jgi:phosphoribosylformylglycinamidine synthase
MVGLLENVGQHVGPWVTAAADRVILLGGTNGSLGASEYLAFIHGQERGRPPVVDLDLEKAVSRVVREAVRAGELHSAHDLSDGGLAVALAEIIFAPGGRLGLDLGLAAPAGRLDALLFGEAGARFVVTLPPGSVTALERRASRGGVDLLDLGRVGTDRLRLKIEQEAVLDHDLTDLRRVWAEALPAAMSAAGVGAGSR